MKNFLFFSLAVMTAALAAVIIVCLISIPSYLEKKSEPTPPPTPPPTPQIKTIEAHLITNRTTMQQTIHMLGNPYDYSDYYYPILTYYLYPVGPCYIISITQKNGITTTKKYAYNKDNYAKNINCGSGTNNSSFDLVFNNNQTFEEIK